MLSNIRDIGGLPAGGGATTRSGVLYRSDAPLHGDPDPDLEIWPPRHVVDLRSAPERAPEHPLQTDATTVAHHPLRDVSDRSGDDLPANLAESYAGLLENGKVIAAIAELIARGDGPVLVHCAAGKDRTGVAVAALLAATGVEREAIIADYVATHPNVEHVYERMLTGVPDTHRPLVEASRNGDRSWVWDTPAEAIESVLDTLGAHPGGAEQWLRDQGVSDDALARLRSALLQ